MPIDCPSHLRGWAYGTHLTQRCVEYNKCPLCSMCQNYDQWSHVCRTCEGRKPKGTVCRCTPEQKLIKVQMEKRFKRPLFSIEGMAMPGLKADVALDAENIALSEKIQREFLGVGSRAEMDCADTGEILTLNT